MKLIDADALLNRMQKDPLFDLVEIYGVSGVIEAEPTVDAVPVIRCNDCKYAYKAFNSYTCQRVFHPFTIEDDGFCSWAERKEK